MKTGGSPLNAVCSYTLPLCLSCCRLYLKVFGHNPYRQHVTKRDGPISDKAAQLLGVIPQSSGGGGGYRRPHVGRGPRGMVEEEVR